MGVVPFELFLFHVREQDKTNPHRCTASYMYILFQHDTQNTEVQVQVPVFNFLQKQKFSIQIPWILP
jgi:hypothetical protein